jgi:hypothetical protein
MNDPAASHGYPEFTIQRTEEMCGPAWLSGLVPDSGLRVLDSLNNFNQAAIMARRG